MNEPKFSVLLVEDDSALSFIIRDNLEQNDYQVDVAEDGLKALKFFRAHHYSIIILDVMLPRLDGFSVAREIRKSNQQVPLIFLTARSMTEDKINGLTIGGDDYITKPFSMEELLLKMKVFLRRSGAPVRKNNLSAEPVIKIGEYVFSEENLTLAHPQFTRQLTLKEAELVKYFAANPNKVLNRDDILFEVWGSNDYFLGRSLDVFISRLRKYFSYDPQVKIVNLHGIGFRFSVKTQ